MIHRATCTQRQNWFVWWKFCQTRKRTILKTTRHTISKSEIYAFANDSRRSRWACQIFSFYFEIKCKKTSNDVCDCCSCSVWSSYWFFSSHGAFWHQFKFYHKNPAQLWKQENELQWLFDSWCDSLWVFCVCIETWKKQKITRNRQKRVVLSCFKNCNKKTTESTHNVSTFFEKNFVLNWNTVYSNWHKISIKKLRSVIDTTIFITLFFFNEKKTQNRKNTKTKSNWKTRFCIFKICQTSWFRRILNRCLPIVLTKMIPKRSTEYALHQKMNSEIQIRRNQLPRLM